MTELKKVSRFQLELDAAESLVNEFRSCGDFVNAGKAYLLLDFIKKAIRGENHED